MSFLTFRGYEEQLAKLPVYCGATFKDKAIEAMRNPLVNWSDYSVEFVSAFGIFIVSLIGLVIVLLCFIVEFCLGVYKVTARRFATTTCIITA